MMQLTVTDLGKEYKRGFWGLKNFSLEIKPGILGLLGPNGAGKSTFMRMLATITKPTDGTITYNNINVVAQPDALRDVLGYLPQDFGVYPNLNAVEFLEYMAAIKGLDAATARKRIDELLQLVNLKDAARRPLGGYSGGMKQRVGIAQALLNDPQLLIVDEPTVGLDPEERVRFRNLLSDLSGERIVILSTHIVSDVEATATHIAMINKGQLLRAAAPEDLLKELDGKVWEWTVQSDDLPALKQKHIISGTIRRSDGVQVRVVSATPPEAQAGSVSPNLEDAYLYFIGGIS
jgi:ABC-type multidrug transport system ATPase subunit